MSDSLPWNSPGQNTEVGSLPPSPGDLPNPGIKARSPALRADSWPAELSGEATHSSIPAWRILWTEKPGRLQSMGSQGSDMTEWLTHTHTMSSVHFVYLFALCNLRLCLLTLLLFLLSFHKWQIHFSVKTLTILSSSFQFIFVGTQEIAIIMP